MEILNSFNLLTSRLISHWQGSKSMVWTPLWFKKNCWRFVFIGLTGLRNEATLKNTNNAQDNAEPLCGHVLMDFSLRVFLLSQIFLCQLVLFNIEQQLISASHTCLKVWKAALYDEPGGNFSTLLQRKETGEKKLWGKEWGKVKAKVWKKNLYPPVPSFLWHWGHSLTTIQCFSSLW